MGGRELSTNSEELLVRCLNILKPPKPPQIHPELPQNDPESPPEVPPKPQLIIFLLNAHFLGTDEGS